MTERELNKIVAAHLPLAAKYTRHFAKRFYLDEDDVYELALEELTIAARTWKPDGGGSFGTYVLKYLAVKLNQRCAILYRRNKQMPVISLNGPPSHAKGTRVEQHKNGILGEAIKDKVPNCYQHHARRQAWNVIAAMLDVREWMIVAYHIGLEPLPQLTQEEIGEKLGVSRQRVQQIEARAFEKIRQAYGETARGRKALHALREFVIAKSA